MQVERELNLDMDFQTSSAQLNACKASAVCNPCPLGHLSEVQHAHAGSATLNLLPGINQSRASRGESPHDRDPHARRQQMRTTD